MKLVFPHRGYHEGSATTQQPAGTSPHLLNVRSFDPLDGKARGGKRPAERKWSDTQVSKALASPVVEMLSVTVVDSV